MKTGYLLMNLGTPDAPDTPSVRRYLREFLLDPDVIDIPWVGRYALVYGVILPFRPKKSAEAYQKVWTEAGSPLLAHSLELVRQVKRQMGEDVAVALGMRYGNPSIESGVKSLLKEKVDCIRALPLYPQYSLAATQSSIKKLKEVLSNLSPDTKLEILPAFYDSETYLDAVAAVSKESLAAHAWDHVLFSFHGLPERQVRKTDPTGNHCFEKPDCCDTYKANNPDCYRAQCFATARGLASRLNIPEEKYSVCFQSRLGRTPWIRPYTDKLLEELPKKGIKNVAVLCPSFVADCLETLEEIQIRGKTSYKDSGGEDLFLVPSLNSSPVWAKAVSEMVRP